MAKTITLELGENLLSGRLEDATVGLLDGGPLIRLFGSVRNQHPMTIPPGSPRLRRPHSRHPVGHRDISNSDQANRKTICCCAKRGRK
jgi:hypothetical protein